MRACWFSSRCWSSGFRRARRAAHADHPNNARRIAESLVERGIAAGATAADALYVGERRRACRCGSASSSSVSRSEGEEIGLRLFVGQRSATVASSDLSDEALAMLVERCLAMAREAPEDPYAGLAPADCSQRGSLPDLDADDPQSRTRPSCARARWRRRRRRLPLTGVTNSSGAGASASATTIALATSGGFSGAYRSTGHGCSAAVDRGRGRDDAARPCLAQRAASRRPRDRSGDRPAAPASAQSRGSTRRGPSPANIRSCSTRASRRAARPFRRSDQRLVGRAQDQLPSGQAWRSGVRAGRHDRRRSAAPARASVAAIRRRRRARRAAGAGVGWRCSRAGSRKAPRRGSSASRPPAMRRAAPAARPALRPSNLYMEAGRAQPRGVACGVSRSGADHRADRPRA